MPTAKETLHPDGAKVQAKMKLYINKNKYNCRKITAGACQNISPTLKTLFPCQNDWDLTVGSRGEESRPHYTLITHLTFKVVCSKLHKIEKYEQLR